MMSATAVPHIVLSAGFERVQVSCHFFGQQLYASGAKQERRINEASIKIHFAISLGVEMGRLEDGIIIRPANSPKPKRKGDGRRTQKGVTFDAGLGIESIDTQQGPIALQRWPPTRRNGLNLIKGTIPMAVELIEWGGEDQEPRPAQFAQGQAAAHDSSLCDSIVSERRLFAGRIPSPEQLGRE